MRRRIFLRQLGLSVIGLKLGALYGCGQAPAPVDQAMSDEGLGEALGALARELEGIDFIGPVCIEKAGPRGAGAELLEMLRATATETLGEALQASVAGDFAAGRIEEIEGWMISRTECLLAAHAAALRGLAVPRLAVTEEFREEEFVEVIDWGPKSTYAGRLFNPLSGDRAGLWIRIASEAPSSTRVVFDGHRLTTHVFEDSLTTSLGAEHARAVIDKPGTYRIELVDPARSRRQHLGVFTVHEPAPPAILADGTESAVFCEVERWGPQEAAAGEPFNLQPDGSSAFWVQMGCAAAGARLVLGPHPLPTHVGTGMVSARLEPDIELEPGTYPLAIEDPDTGERLEIGEFQVR